MDVLTLLCYAAFLVGIITIPASGGLCGRPSRCTFQPCRLGACSSLNRVWCRFWTRLRRSLRFSKGTCPNCASYHWSTHLKTGRRYRISISPCLIVFRWRTLLRRRCRSSICRSLGHGTFLMKSYRCTHRHWPIFQAPFHSLSRFSSLLRKRVRPCSSRLLCLSSLHARSCLYICCSFRRCAFRIHEACHWAILHRIQQITYHCLHFCWGPWSSLGHSCFHL